MKLDLLEIDNFISRNKLKPITSTKMYVGGGKDSLDPNGLFSEEIFGRLGSRERRTTFGYIDLNIKIIHPEAWPIITNLNTDLTKYIMGKNTYKIDSEGSLIQDDEGTSGLYSFITNFNKINFKDINPKKKKEIDFILNNKNNVLIDKFLVLPAGVRDMHISRSSGKTIIQYSEITQLYEKLIKQTNSVIGDIEALGEDVANSIIERIQHTVNSINSWFKDRMKGKFGLIRGGMLKKITDYSGRMILTPDPDLDLGWCGIPWQVVLKIHEPYTLNFILQKDSSGIPLIQQYLNTTDNLDINDLKRFISKINESPKTVSGQLKDYLVYAAREIVRDRVIIYKRDPTENRDSWVACYVRVDTDGFVFKTNPFDLCKNGGDYDGDAASIFALLTDQAQEEAKKELCPIHTKSAWTPGQTANKTAYSIELDASTAIYAATKN